MVARPQTYMNHSGQSVGRLTNKYHIHPDNLLVIHDDMDLPPGKIRIRQGGGSGGHRGIYSVMAELGSQDVLRIRVGIGRPSANEDLAGTSETDVITYVLSDFTPDEKQVIEEVLPVVSEAILCLINQGLEAAMNKYN